MFEGWSIANAIAADSHIKRRTVVHKTFREMAESMLGPGDEGEDKVTTLEAAIEQYVRHGMALHFGGEPCAALRQILRQFWGQNPRFTLISGTVTFPYATSLVYCAMASRVIASAFQRAIHGPSTYPNRLTTTMPPGHEIETENWSLYSIEQRLMAGALGVGFMPTKSIIGSDMAEENKASFRVITDPFDSSRKEGIVRALAPDLSFVHGCAADRYGNTILPLPSSDAIWGPRASRGGVVVTVEKIVPTDFIRQHAGLVKLPGYLVKAVCLAPLGAHPHGMVNSEARGFEGYEADWDFLNSYALAASSYETLNAWIKEWAVDCPDQNDYLRKLGHERILSLKAKARWHGWDCQSAGMLGRIPAGKQFTRREMMLIAAAREIKEKVMRNGYRTVLSGTGVQGLAACLAYYWLRQEGYGVDLAWGLGRIGYMPLPGQTSPMGVSHTLTSKVLTDIGEIYGIVVGGRNAKCISVLGALQIDRFGNINNSRVGQLSIGSGGAADAINANETVVVVQHSPNRIVEKVGYVTCPGDRVKTLVSSMGIFRKLGEDKEFSLTECFPNLQPPATEKTVETIAEICGWELKVDDDVTEIPPPAEEELRLLRLLDADRSAMND